MLRRVANVCAARSPLAAAGVATATSASPIFTHQQPPLQLQTRWATSEAAQSINNNNNNDNRNRNVGPNRQRNRRASLPPAFDIVHWNDEDISRGYLLRVLHRNGYIVLDYHRQRSATVKASAEDAAADTTASAGRRENRAEKVVTVTLPPVYVARFLGVLEGRMDKVEVQSRFTNATFAPDAAQGKHHHTLHCTSMRPTTGQAQTIDGADVHEETVEWTVSLDAAESLMLHRFLTQALHQNSGFGRNV